jgi:hypothetical protein
MKGMCQSCGVVAPVEWFLAEPVRRRFEAVLIETPKPVQEQAFFYLALFRPLKNGSLTNKKALRLLTELRDLVKQGYVSKPSCVDRPCPPQIWAQAMETMVNQRHGLTLPMPNHNYLCKVAYDKADAVDFQAERSRETGLRNKPGRSAEPEKIGGGLDREAYLALNDKEKQFIPAHIRAKYESE